MMKVVLKLDYKDEKTKQKAMKKVSSLDGVESISIDKDQKLTVTGSIDAVSIVGKLRKICNTDIVSVGPKEAEKKKDDGKKDEGKKDDKKGGGDDKKKDDNKKGGGDDKKKDDNKKGGGDDKKKDDNKKGGGDDKKKDDNKKGGGDDKKKDDNKKGGGEDKKKDEAAAKAAVPVPQQYPYYHQQQHPYYHQQQQHPYYNQQYPQPYSHPAAYYNNSYGYNNRTVEEDPNACVIS